MIPTERVVVVVVVIASRPFASRPSRSRRSLDRRSSSVDAKSQMSSTRRAVASTIDDRIESNRPRRVRAVGRSVGRSMVASSKNTSTRRRSIQKSIDASSIVSNRRRRSSHREGDHRASRANPRRRRRPARRGFADADNDGEEKRQGGDERAERRAGGHADGVGATDDGARERTRTPTENP